MRLFLERTTRRRYAHVQVVMTIMADQSTEGVRIPALHSVVGRFCSVFGIVYVEQLLEPAWGAFLSRGFVDSHGFPFHALVLRARRA